MKKINNKIKRKLRNRKKLKKVNTNRFRISVSKSLNNLFAQIIDDKTKKTIVSASSIENVNLIISAKKPKKNILKEKKGKNNSTIKSKEKIKKTKTKKKIRTLWVRRKKKS